MNNFNSSSCSPVSNCFTNSTTVSINKHGQLANHLHKQLHSCSGITRCTYFFSRSVAWILYSTEGLASGGTTFC
ncbi:Mitotic checkpoint protein [Trichinella pseudospiralis]